MSSSRLRWLGLGLVSSAGAGLLALTSIMNTAFAYGDSGAPPGIEPPAGNGDVTFALLQGSTGNPIPQEAFGGDYMNEVFTDYLAPNFPNLVFTPTTPAGLCETTTCGEVTGLASPEGGYPTTGVNSLPLDTSVIQGQTILDQAITGQLASLPATADLGVFGYSQSAIIASLEMQSLDPSGTPSSDPLNFVLIGDLMNPNGGLDERFDGLNLASLGFNFYGSTPSDDFSTAIYTLEYDGYADFPKYPIDFFADLNAFLGIQTIHGTYPELTQAELDSAFLLPGSMTVGGLNTAADACADCLTNYFMIDQTPPLVSLLGGIPVIGGPLQDLLGPDLTYLINLGYGPDDVGYSTPANVATEFGLFPDVSLSTIFSNLFTDTQQGITNFIADLMGTGPNPLSLAALADPLSVAATVSAAAGDPVTFTDIVNAFSNAASAAYGTLLPTADIINSLLTSVPAYDLSLFVDNLQSGDILDAIGLPIAAETAMLTLGAGIEFGVIESAVTSIISDFTSL